MLGSLVAAVESVELVELGIYVDGSELVSVTVGSLEVVEGSAVLVGSPVSVLVEGSTLTGSEVLNGGSVTVETSVDEVGETSVDEVDETSVDEADETSVDDVDDTTVEVTGGDPEH